MTKNHQKFGLELTKSPESLIIFPSSAEKSVQKIHHGKFFLEVSANLKLQSKSQKIVQQLLQPKDKINTEKSKNTK